MLIFHKFDEIVCFSMDTNNYITYLRVIKALLRRIENSIYMKDVPVCQMDNSRAQIHMKTLESILLSKKLNYLFQKIAWLEGKCHEMENIMISVKRLLEE